MSNLKNIEVKVLDSATDAERTKAETEAIADGSKVVGLSFQETKGEIPMSIYFPEMVESSPEGIKATLQKRFRVAKNRLHFLSSSSDHEARKKARKELEARRSFFRVNNGNYKKKKERVLLKQFRNDIESYSDQYLKSNSNDSTLGKNESEIISLILFSDNEVEMMHQLLKHLVIDDRLTLASTLNYNEVKDKTCQRKELRSNYLRSNMRRLERNKEVTLQRYYYNNVSCK